jgi:hypothetical protein
VATFPRIKPRVYTQEKKGKSGLCQDRAENQAMTRFNSSAKAFAKLDEPFAQGAALNPGLLLRGIFGCNGAKRLGEGVLEASH